VRLQQALFCGAVESPFHPANRLDTAIHNNGYCCIPFNATTRFTPSDEEIDNVVEYTFAPGDANVIGTVHLADIAYVQNGIGSDDTAPLFGVFDFNRDGVVDQSEFLGALSNLSVPLP